MYMRVFEKEEKNCRETSYAYFGRDDGYRSFAFIRAVDACSAEG